MDSPKVKVNYFISVFHRDSVQGAALDMSRQFGVKVQIGDALEKIIDFYLSNRSVEGLKTLEQIETAADAS